MRSRTCLGRLGARFCVSLSLLTILLCAGATEAGSLRADRPPGPIAHRELRIAAAKRERAARRKEENDGKEWEEEEQEEDSESDGAGRGKRRAGPLRWDDPAPTRRVDEEPELEFVSPRPGKRRRHKSAAAPPRGKAAEPPAAIRRKAQGSAAPPARKAAVTSAATRGKPHGKPQGRPHGKPQEKPHGKPQGKPQGRPRDGTTGRTRVEATRRAPERAPERAPGGEAGGTAEEASKHDRPTGKGQGSRAGAAPATSVEREEQKVTLATLKLVHWLRNRLRKRLKEIADLEGALATAEHAAANLAADQKRVAADREREIQLKIEGQKALAEFRRNAAEPDDQLRIVGEQTRKLERQLADMSATYDALAKVQAEMEGKMRSAGFSHWLDARGQRYMPETAVGVLAKSAEILDPVVAGIGRAVAMDAELAAEVEQLVPIAHSPLVSGVVSDIFVLVPVIPMLALAGRVSYSMHGLTALHYIFYLSWVFAVQCAGCFLVSLALAEEAIHYFQRTNEPAMIGVLFATAGLYTCFTFLHALVALVHSTPHNLAHLVAVNGIGYYFYTSVFRPAVLDRPADFPVLTHAAHAVAFLYIATARNAALQLDVPLQHELRALFGAAHAWLDETADAMRVSVLGGGGGVAAEAQPAAPRRLAGGDGAPSSYYSEAGGPALAPGESRSSAYGAATVPRPRYGHRGGGRAYR